MMSEKGRAVNGGGVNAAEQIVEEVRQKEGVMCVHQSGGKEEKEKGLFGHVVFFFFQAEDGIRDVAVTGVDVCSSDLIDNNYSSLGDDRENSLPTASGILVRKLA